MSFYRYVNIAKTTRRPPSASLLPSGNVSSMVKPAQPVSSSPLSQPSRTSNNLPPLPSSMRQHSVDDLSNSPYSSLEESNGYGSFPGGTVVYPHSGTTFILPSNISPMMGLGGGGSGNPHGTTTYHHGSSSLDSYSSLPPQPPPTANNYSTYEPMRGGSSGYDSTSSSSRGYVVPRGGGGGGGGVSYDQPRNESVYEPNKRMMIDNYSKR